MPLEKWGRLNYAEDMIKYLYGETADWEDVKKVYFGSIMYRDSVLERAAYLKKSQK